MVYSSVHVAAHRWHHAAHLTRCSDAEHFTEAPWNMGFGFFILVLLRVLVVLWCTRTHTLVVVVACSTHCVMLSHLQCDVQLSNTELPPPATDPQEDWNTYVCLGMARHGTARHGMVRHGRQGQHHTHTHTLTLIHYSLNCYIYINLPSIHVQYTLIGWLKHKT